MRYDRHLITLLLILVSGIPAIHKLSGAFPPEWFQAKFGASFLGALPAGITISYVLIVALEVLVPLLLIGGIAKGELKHPEIGKLTGMGFYALLVLFIVLFFGSFLVEDYSNGFFDFTYFVGVYILRSKYREAGHVN